MNPESAREPERESLRNETSRWACGTPIILLTGGSGLVGRSLVPLLARQPGHRLVNITRTPARTSAHPALTALQGDLCLPGLGLDEVTTRELQAHTSEIIHCAADVNFGAPLESALAVNVDGTLRILDFAERCPKLQKFAHLSTLYIAGRRPGLVREELLHHDSGYCNSYEQSKHEAEEKVFERMRTLPIAIYRLSAIIGHSLTGNVTQPNFFHALIRMAPVFGVLGAIPGNPETPVDLIADDWCANAFMCLYRLAFTPGSVFHICAGQHGALPAQDVMDLVFHCFEANTGVRLRTPELMMPEDFERFTAMPLGRRAQVRRLVDTMSGFLPHLSLSQPFDEGIAGRILGGHGLAPPPALPFLHRVSRKTIPCRGDVPGPAQQARA